MSSKENRPRGGVASGGDAGPGTPAASLRVRSVTCALVSFATAVALAAVGAGCAKPGPPGGGPPDEQPPEVVSTRPADAATMVDTDSELEIEFSEEMNRPSVERSLAIVPDVGRLDMSWKGRTLFVDPAESFPESTTVVVEIASSAQDYHNVASGRPFSFAFSTGPSMDSGIISGIVTAGGDPMEGAVVWACAGAALADSTGVVRPCGYGTSSGEDGTFTIRRVRPTATPYTIVAFMDANGDRRYAPSSETGGVLDDAAFVESQGDSVGGLVVPIEPPPPGENGPEENNPQESTEEDGSALQPEQTEPVTGTEQEPPATREGLQ